MFTDQPLIDQGMPFSRRARRLVLILVLLAGLFHAWGGHDWLFGHHHRQLGEASYSTSSGYEEGQRTTQVVLTLIFPSHLLSLEAPLSYAAVQVPISAFPKYRPPVSGKPDHPRPPPALTV